MRLQKEARKKEEAQAERSVKEGTDAHLLLGDTWLGGVCAERWAFREHTKGRSAKEGTEASPLLGDTSSMMIVQRGAHLGPPASCFV